MQVVSNQLCATTQERDELAELAQLAATRAAYHEQLLRAREGDLGDVRTAYEVRGGGWVAGRLGVSAGV